MRLSKFIALFSEKNNNPIKAIIYTHNHGDHTFGAAYYVQSQKKNRKLLHMKIQIIMCKELWEF